MPDDIAQIDDFVQGRTGNQIDFLIVRTVRAKGWGEGFDSEDVIQNTRLALLKIFRQGSYSPGNLAAYVRQVAEIQCAMEMRRRYRSKRYEELSSKTALGQADPAPGPLEGLLSEENRGNFITLLKGLDKPCLQLLIFRFYKRLSFKEIGVHLALSEVNARVKIHRCLKKAKEIYEKIEENA